MFGTCLTHVRYIAVFFNMLDTFFDTCWEHFWDVVGTCWEHVWNMFDTFSTHFRLIFGTHSTNYWFISGKNWHIFVTFRELFRRIFDAVLTHVWHIFGKCLAYVCDMPAYIFITFWDLFLRRSIFKKFFLGVEWRIYLAFSMFLCSRGGLPPPRTPPGF